MNALHAAAMDAVDRGRDTWPLIAKALDITDSKAKKVCGELLALGVIEQYAKKENFQTGEVLSYYRITEDFGGGLSYRGKMTVKEAIHTLRKHRGVFDELRRD